jgi:hypothetical protein
MTTSHITTCDLCGKVESDTAKKENWVAIYDDDKDYDLCFSCGQPFMVFLEQKMENRGK